MNFRWCSRIIEAFTYAHREDHIYGDIYHRYIYRKHSTENIFYTYRQLNRGIITSTYIKVDTKPAGYFCLLHNSIFNVKCIDIRLFFSVSHRCDLVFLVRLLFWDFLSDVFVVHRLDEVGGDDALALDEDGAAEVAVVTAGHQNLGDLLGYLKRNIFFSILDVRNTNWAEQMSIVVLKSGLHIRKQ